MSKSMFIFRGAVRVSDSYHYGGALAVVAETLDAAVSLVHSTKVGDGDYGDDNTMEIGEYALKNVVEYPLDGNPEDKIYSFPDAGCC